ncbi:MAG TPA: HD-GYP domain-containing protein [Streptosporangiaceae bacterium]|nr:HD-GYP domain-containing protein [Streptosporangiaceae bacterium]
MVSRPARLYVALVVVLTGLLVSAVSTTPALSPDTWGLMHPSAATGGVRAPLLAVVTLAVLFLVCEAFDTPLSGRQTKWSPSSAATLAAAVLLGPLAAAFVGGSSLLSLQRKLRLLERIFNGAMHALCGLAAGTVYLAVGGWLKRLAHRLDLAAYRHDLAAQADQALLRHDRLLLHPPTLVGLPDVGHFWVIFGAFAAASAVYVLTNHWLIWAICRLDRGGGMMRREGLESSLPLLLASDFGYACFGLVIASLWAIMGWFSAVLVLVTLFVARWAMRQFAEQQRAYAATMDALCQAVETKDYYTRGHGDRVSRGAVLIARKIHMSPGRTEAIRVAGMLHDVGKIGVPTQILQKTGPLTDEELAAIQLHPSRGLEIVGKIQFLKEALIGIKLHHERMDGTGYPMGLVGHEIPEFARIIAVADAFDSMTTTRSYREAKSIDFALDQLRKGAGSQFDPRMVVAFITALDEQRWPLPEPPPEPADPTTVTVQDHDDPTAPLRIVEP